MAIVINGSGTVTGLSVGGLPDGTVDSDTLASGIDKTSISDSGDATAITIDSSERVGIGTGSPTARLHVYNANDHVRLSAQCAQNTGQHWQFQSRNNGEFWLRNETTGSNKLIMDSTGAVTMPSQPAFLVKNAQLDNISVSTVTTIPYSNELFDQNSDFNTSTYTFTAPVTGKYQLNVSTYLNAVPVNAQYIQVRIVTSNHTYSTIIDPNFSAGLDYYSQNISVLADMDANDTAYVALLQQAGTQQLDIQGSGFFSGYLVA
jgi:hypothetical protein